MKIKLKHNQPRESLIFNVKDLTDTYDYMVDDTIDETIDDYIHDIVAATAQNKHEYLVEALNGLKGAVATQELNGLKKPLYRLLGRVDMDYAYGD